MTEDTCESTPHSACRQGTPVSPCSHDGAAEGCCSYRVGHGYERCLHDSQNRFKSGFKKQNTGHTCSLLDSPTCSKSMQFNKTQIICKQDLGHFQKPSFPPAKSSQPPNLQTIVRKPRISENAASPGPHLSQSDTVGLGCCPRSWSFHSSPGDPKVPPGPGTTRSGA